MSSTSLRKGWWKQTGDVEHEMETSRRRKKKLRPLKKKTKKVISKRKFPAYQACEWQSSCLEEMSWKERDNQVQGSVDYPYQHFQISYLSAWQSPPSQERAHLCILFFWRVRPILGGKKIHIIIFHLLSFSIQIIEKTNESNQQ